MGIIKQGLTQGPLSHFHFRLTTHLSPTGLSAGETAPRAVFFGQDSLDEESLAEIWGGCQGGCSDPMDKREAWVYNKVAADSPSDLR